MSQNPFQPPADDSLAVHVPQATVAPETAREIGERIQRLNRNSLLIGGVALLFQIMSQGMAPLPKVVVYLASTAALVYGLSLYARMRNQSPWFGALGLLSCLGLVVLLFLPKKCHNCNAKTKAKTCSQCGAPAPL